METIYLDNPEAILSKSSILECVLPRLCRSGADPRRRCFKGDSLDALVTMPYLDLKLYFAVRIGRTACLVTENVRKMAGLTAEEILEASIRNSRDRAVIRPLSDFLSLVPMPEDPPYIITTRGGFGGAAAGLIHIELLSGLAEKLGVRYLFLLPSSVHEVIVLPACPEDKRKIDEMVASINKEEVDEEDQLADHCYLFDALPGEITF